MQGESKYAQAYIEIGNQHFSRGRYKKALKAYKMSILYDPNFSTSYLNLGITYWKLGFLEDALEELEEAFSLHPMNGKISEYIEIVSEELARKKTVLGGNSGNFISRLKSVFSTNSPQG